MIRFRQKGWRQASPNVSLPEVHGSVPIPATGFWRKLMAFAGPGYLVAVGYMDPGNWATDLEQSRGCLLEAGGQIDDALVAGRFPVLLAGDCSIAMTTLPTVVRHAPEAHVLWLDAHGDFNTPETTESGFLGGMCLAAACGRWDAGLAEEHVDPAQVVMCGTRDLDGQERVLLETAGVRTIRPSKLADMLDGEDVFVHLDLDVLDPSVLPAQFPAEGGLSDGGLRTLLGEVAEVATLLGLEVTAFEAPEDEAERTALAETVATVVGPLVRQAVGA